MKPHKPVDRNGKPIKVGDLVRIVGVPDLSGMSADGLAESLPAFQFALGRYKRVEGFDEYGCAEFSFTMKHENGERHWHSIWVEPFLLHIPIRRPNPSFEEGRRKSAAPLN
jgi:hypothetical protein